MLLIEKNVVEALLRYLSNRPWNEVQEVMPVLMKLEELPAPRRTDREPLTLDLENA